MPDLPKDLAGALERTEDAVQRLARTVDFNEATLRRVAVAISVGLAGLILDLVLTVAVGWGYFGVTSNQDKISDLQESAQVETERNRSAQCAVNALLLQFAPRTTVNPSYTEEQRAQQIQAYQTLRQISADLGCPGQ